MSMSLSVNLTKEKKMSKKTTLKSFYIYQNSEALGGNLEVTASVIIDHPDKPVLEMKGLTLPPEIEAQIRGFVALAAQHHLGGK